MKGIIFNEFESFVTEKFGEGIYEKIFSASHLITSEPFVGPGTYPDEDLLALVSAAVEILNISLPNALREFGRYCLPKLAGKYPDFIKDHKDPKSFLLTVDSVIHVEVKKLYADAKLPRFVYKDTSPHSLEIEYTSDRKFCHFMEGLIDGVSTHFKRPISHQQFRCMLKGDLVCEFHLNFG